MAASRAMKAAIKAPPTWMIVCWSASIRPVTRSSRLRTSLLSSLTRSLRPSRRLSVQVDRTFFMPSMLGIEVIHVGHGRLTYCLRPNLGRRRMDRQLFGSFGLHRKRVDGAVIEALLHRRLDQPVLGDSGEALELRSTDYCAQMIAAAGFVAHLDRGAGQRRLDHRLQLRQVGRHRAA